MALHHENATLESPLVCHLLRSERGIIAGREELREFVRRVFEHQPPERRRFRSGLLTDGNRVTWEYPRVSPDGEQMDIVEVLEVCDGLISPSRLLGLEKRWHADPRRARRVGISSPPAS